MFRLVQFAAKIGETGEFGRLGPGFLFAPADLL